MSYHKHIETLDIYHSTVSSYSAHIVELTNVREHPNADRLKLATALGHQVVVGLDTENGQVGVFFPTDGQLSESYAEANDLVARHDPETGKKIGGGFFSEKRRVRAQSFRGERSEGFFTELDTLSFTGVDITKLSVGDEFTALNGIEICNKYFTPATRQAANKKRQRSRRETPMFPMHFDTKPYRFYQEAVANARYVVATEKEHGTSGRFGHVLEEVPSKWNRFLPRFLHRHRREWTYLMGTRRVIVDRREGDGFYGTDSFREEAVAPLRGNLHKGEVVFFEIVGYVHGNTPIMPSHSTKEVPEIRQKYGDSMHYTYGCTPEGEEGPTRRLRVYRIAMVNEDGVMIDLSWEGVKRRCRELGVEHVYDMGTWTPYHAFDLGEFLEALTEGSSFVDPTHIREGICIRIEDGSAEPLILKNKSFSFGVMEGYIKQQDSYVDMEEAA